MDYFFPKVKILPELVYHQRKVKGYVIGLRPFDFWAYKFIIIIIIIIVLKKKRDIYLQNGLLMLGNLIL